MVNTTAKVIAEGKPADNEAALKLAMPSGETLEEAYVNATATIGEKISFRRFALVEKQMLKHLVHTNITAAVSVLSQLLKVATKLLQNKSQCTSRDETNCSFLH